MPIDLSQHLSSASLQQRRVYVCLRGDLTGALIDAQAELDAYAASTADVAIDARLGNRKDPRAVELRERVAGLTEQVREAALPFVVQGLSRPAREALLAQNPARVDDADDRRVGYNRETYETALLRRCLVDPAIADDEQWAQLTSVLTDGQQLALMLAAVETTHGGTEIPFSSTNSGTKTASDEK